MDHLPANIRGDYLNLAGDPRYRHFVHIPDRIIRCIDYFGIPCDRTAARTRLLAYYLFIGVVDDAIDSGSIDAGGSILEYLNNRVPVFDATARCSSVKLVTEILKCNIDDATYPLMMDKLKELYFECVVERGATSIDSYIDHRESVGSLTAELSYLLIRSTLSGDHEKLSQFMQQVGAIGCLVDSLIDLSADCRLGLLGFRPGFPDYAKLTITILRDGLRMSVNHLGLSGLFLIAIVDNVLDSFRAAQDRPQPCFVSDRKDKAASVA